MIFPVVPGFMPGIHAFTALHQGTQRYTKEDVDGRDKPGHDKLQQTPISSIDF